MYFIYSLYNVYNNTMDLIKIDNKIDDINSILINKINTISSNKILNGDFIDSNLYRKDILYINDNINILRNDINQISHMERTNQWVLP